MTRVSEIMTSDVSMLAPDMTLRDALSCRPNRIVRAVAEGKL
jgi:hypothetical protein